MGKSREKTIYTAVAALFCAAIFAVAFFYIIRHTCFPRPYQNIVLGSGVECSLVYSVMKAESGFDENAISPAGAIGLMQLMPATAEFVCRMNGLEYHYDRLKEGEYNTKLGCLYLEYLLNRFESEETALAAYNAGEGTVSEWLKKREFSPDGKSLELIPYEETARYVKKVENFRKKYQFFYH